jgi:hypothetical protein
MSLARLLVLRDMRDLETPTFRSPSYAPCECGEDCPCRSTEERPCWGAVTVVDEIPTEDGPGFIHACEGHAKPVTDSGDYTPERKPKP